MERGSVIDAQLTYLEWKTSWYDVVMEAVSIGWDVEFIENILSKSKLTQ
jgi:hypothetical protein